MLRLSLLTIAACASAPRPAASPAATGGAPCFPGRPALDAPKVHQELEKYAWSLYASPEDPPIPDGTYGECKVSKNVVSAKDGTVVAELGCGVRILVPGIRDELGIQLGARGNDVLARKPKPVKPLACFADGPDHARCHFDRDVEDTDPTSYVVAGALETAIKGDEAVAFFRDRVITEIEYSAWCH